MRKKAAFIALFTALLLLAGCASGASAVQPPQEGSPPEFNLSAFLNEDEEFYPPGIAYGLSPKEAEEALGLSFADADNVIDVDLRDGDQGHYRLVYTFDNAAQGYSYPISVAYEFLDEKLGMVSYFFDTPIEEVDALYERIEAEALGLYGDPYEKPGINYDLFKVWRKDETVLGVTNSKHPREETGKSEQVIVAVYHIEYGMTNPPQD